MRLRGEWVGEDCLRSKQPCKNGEAPRNSIWTAKFALVPPTVRNVTPPSLCHLHHHLLIPMSPVSENRSICLWQAYSDLPPKTDSNEKLENILKKSQNIYTYIHTLMYTFMCMYIVETRTLSSYVSQVGSYLPPFLISFTLCALTRDYLWRIRIRVDGLMPYDLHISNRLCPLRDVSIFLAITHGLDGD